MRTTNRLPARASRRLGLVAVASVVALGIGMQPALADEPIHLPVAPDETVVLDEGREYVPEDTLPVHGTGQYCDPHNIYGIYSNTANDMKVFDRLGATNSTGSTISATFRADTGGTTTQSASITLEAEVGAVFSKVKASVNGSIATTMTASTGVSVTSSVKPHSTLKGDYGIWRENVKMKRNYMYSNCQYGPTQYFSYSAPYRKGWRVYY
jgi:hypothetical protein